MGNVTKLTVSKGKTVKATDRDEWLKIEYSIEAAVDNMADLEAAKAHLEGLLDGWLTGTGVKPVVMQPTNIFPKELADLLTFEEKGEYIIIKPKAYLGTENFSRIADIIKKHGGEYISAGRESHFRIPRKTAK